MGKRLLLATLCLIMLFTATYAEQAATAPPVEAEAAAAQAVATPTAEPVQEVTDTQQLPLEPGQTLIPPIRETPEFVIQLLSVAREELGYTERKGGYSKFGEWSGDSYAQWCAEFLCWSVDQTDKRFGTNLLKVQYPLYSGTNVGRDWFIRQGRYIDRTGSITNWGTQWLMDKQAPMLKNEYIPQPGDWMFFTWRNGPDTDHVAMVEYCTTDSQGQVTIHVIEGNNPSAVARNAYLITDPKILGYGTVHDLAGVTMRYGNKGVKVRQLQERLYELGLLKAGEADGVFGANTTEAIRTFQATLTGKKVTGIADMDTQWSLADAIEMAKDQNLDNFVVAEK